MKYSTQQILEEFSELARVLGSVHRIILLQHIVQCERSVDRLASLSSLSIANTSQHLQHLKRVGLIKSRRNGKQMLYSLGEGPIVELLQSLRNLAEFQRMNINNLIKDTLNDADSIEGISRAELVERVASGNVVLLDVRPAEEFEYGHLPQALNIPFDELETRLNELPKDKEILAYCRAPYCVLSSQAVEILRKNNLLASRLKDGFGANQDDIELTMQVNNPE